MKTKTNQAPSPASAASPALAEPADAFGAAFGALWKSITGLSLPQAQVAAIQGDYLKQAAAVWNQALQLPSPNASSTPPATPPIADRRFGASEWGESPAASFAARLYLLNAQTLNRLADSVEGDAKTKARIRFAVQQWVEAASPSNCLALNPEALHKALVSQGESIVQGMQHLLADLRRGQLLQTDESVFEIGRNVASTEGSVVFENELIQLIEYKPLTAQVHARPILFVPPCINKYYILDLQPDNSLIRYTVAQGHRCFVISWRNPDDSLVAKTWDDYIEQGPIAAIQVVQALSGAQTINTLGFCVGGTLLANALAVLAARGQHPAHSVTLLTTLLDFESTGILDIFVDETLVQMREMTIGAQAPNGPGLLKGRELAATFSALRPNELVWNYVVGNYLKGETPPAFDLLYWNGDSTNLPGPMYCWYLRHMYLHNKLRQPGALTVCGEAVDLGLIRAPFFIYGSRDDHIVPWTAAYASVPLVTGGRHANPVDFVLGASGHIAGVINPPAKGKRSHWTHPKQPPTAAAWLEGATEHPGSWWPRWSAWLAPHGGRMIKAPREPGNAQFKPIEPAPGRYVKARA
jgi:polyhydroxyalkanoate synthase